MAKLFRMLSLLPVLAAAITLPVSAQFQSGSLYGVVYSAADESPIPQAAVYIQATSQLTSTNSNGFYIIGNVPYGTYEVTASAEGYIPDTQQITIGADSTEFNFFLEQTSAGITLTSPRSGDTFYAGSVMPIRWTTQFASESTVTIYIYKGASSDTPEIITVENETDHGSFDFQIPADYPPGGDYYVHIEFYYADFFFFDQAVVTIAQPSIVVNQPSGRVRFTAGEILSVRWQSTGIEGEVGIDLLHRLSTTPNQYGVVESLTARTSNDGNFDWTIPSDISGGDFYRIRVYSVADPVFFGQSADFGIDPLEAPQIIVDPTNIDFGTVGIGQTSAVRTVTITNEGDQVLTGSFQLTGDETNSFDITTQGRSFELGSGDELNLEVIFQPAVEGYSQAIIEITHNATNVDSPVEVLLQGIGELSRQIVVTRPNSGESFTAGGTLPIRWEATGIEGGMGIDLLQRRADNHDVYDVVETLAESTSNDGAFDWQISETYPGGDFFRVMVYSLSNESLRGLSGDFSIEALTQAALSVSPTEIDFGTVEVGQTTSERTVTITNEGDLPLAGEIMLAGNDDEVFEITSGSGGFELGGGDELEVNVVFRPVESGTFQAILQITHDAPNDDGVTEVPLLGTATLRQEIAIIRPASGDSFTAGTTEEIRWTSQGEIPRVDIFLVRNGSVTLQIASGIENSGSFSWQIPASIPEAAEYQIRMVHSDNPEVWVLSEGTFSITSLAIDVSYTQTPGGLQVDVNTNGGFNPSERVLFYRRGGEFRESSWQQIQIGGGDGSFTASIPASYVTERGIDFYVRLSLGETTLTFPRNLATQGPQHVRVQMTEAQAPFSLSPRTYRMISVPLELTENGTLGALEDDYGPYDTSRWRLLRWNSGVDDYDELPELGTPLTPGTAFWLITTGDQSFDVGSALSVDASRPFDLQLQPGWNQVANPFAFPVAWMDVISWNADRFDGNFESSVGPLAFYSGVEILYAEPTQVLSPWDGYFLFNATNGPVTIQIPPREATEVSDVAGKHASKSVATDGSYTIQIVATIPGLPLVDSQNWVGFYDENAKPVQYLEAPGIGPHLRLSLIDSNSRYARLLMPMAEGQTWDVEIGVESGAGIQLNGKLVRVKLEELGIRPEGMDLHVLDLDQNQRLPVEDGVFEVALDGRDDLRHLRIVLGTPKFVDGHLEGIPLAELSNTLEQNYPNPFAGSTSIGYRIVEQSTVLIEVFNTLGQKVQTLVSADQPAGRYVVEWDGRTASGSLASSGMYLCRIRAGTFTATTTMLLVR